ncbi:hypothetical protein FLA105534_02094 [Flavobacterium bizetiae]|uniref:Uncharacterized protein n=1 Tax=Flavobacterium bizetiae TaxID=2704140 RepID=A0A6J4GHM7_9FLAO|nr:hypothetical protein [Flavobacterium bizetiae]CAA9198411.1 hypothetical protein FLA105534_02094 [Flavobacterium bizetiae]CAD5342063.1 hypothetical protein FLA105535_02042 [Flavobacterium bizetiae]CAD5349138.1 hypothetical protein FLA105534_03120 [Flavobacterium bizetiae]
MKKYIFEGTQENRISMVIYLIIIYGFSLYFLGKIVGKAIFYFSHY